MKKILYLMHIPWGWIKQRPHFFAEYLASDNIIDVYYRKSNTVSQNKLLTSEQVGIPNISIKGFNNIPFKKIPLFKNFNLDWINAIIAYIQLPSVRNYDYVWITSPIIYSFLRYSLYGKKIIYDCMDDMIEFPDIKNHPLLEKEILNNEKELLMKAHIVFVSSDYLKNKVQERANLRVRNIHTINNAVELPSLDKKEKLPQDVADKVTFIRNMSFPFMYVGMISEWFNFSLIKKTVENFPQLNIVLLGPCDTDIVKHERIHYLGIVERRYIFDLMKEAYSLIMPFQLNELIYSVNPVKLYEYIYTGKPVVSVEYGETKKFANFVSLYNRNEDFFELVAGILNSPEKYVKKRELIDLYIRENTWYARYNQILKLLGL